jgi:TRAP-type C4-dicarboxylate transport system permease small subunit
MNAGAGTVVRRIAEWWAIAGGLVLLAIVLVTAANAGAFAADRLARSWGGTVAALPGYEDFVRLAISGAALMFFPYAQAERGHVAVDIFVGWLPAGLRRLLERLWLLLTIAIGLFLAWWMWFGMARARADALVTGVLGWPDWPFYLPGIASLVLWAAVAAVQLADPADG